LKKIKKIYLFLKIFLKRKNNQIIILKNWFKKNTISCGLKKIGLQKYIFD